MITPFLSVSQWCSFPSDIRQKLIRVFELNRSGGTEVALLGGAPRVLSDGHTERDLSAINVETMQRILNTTSTDFFSMLNVIIEDADKYIEIKTSGAVDRLWHYKETIKTFDEPDEYVVSEPLLVGDVVRIKNGHVYKVSKLNTKMRHSLIKKDEARKKDASK